ncbi:MAG: IS21 family transposase [Pseudomonadales bacterium]|nr:IS21 family transposase [Pseudomonadales bacterium]
MLTQEFIVEIHVLSRQGHSVKAIARQLGVSRNTVRKYLRDNTRTPQYATRVPRPSKLDPFKTYLQERQAAASPHWIPATVLLREIQAKGYTGGISLIKVFIGSRHAVSPEPVVRFETPQGQQLQVDFTTIRRGQFPLKAFVATLGYSRATYVRFSAREDSQAWMDGMREAFVFFGGVPKELLFDNAKALMLERDAYGEGRHRWNPTLLALADEFGFKPRACRPYRARTKGKVERFNGYLKGSFITPLAATLKSAGLLLDVDTANGQIGRWLQDIAHQRIHGTTGEKPQLRLEQERHAFLPLPEKAWKTVSLAINPSSHLTRGIAMPYESLQHPLSVYDALLGVPA